MLKKEERALKGKVVKEFAHSAYYNLCVIKFTDGSLVRLAPGSAGIHNDRWSTVESTYYESEEAFNERFKK